MKILKVKYIENGYFQVKYHGLEPVIQDLTAMKMTNIADPGIKDVLLFLRKIKIDKISNKEIDETEYRDYMVYDLIEKEAKLERDRKLAVLIPKSDTDLDALLGSL